MSVEDFYLVINSIKGGSIESKLKIIQRLKNVIYKKKEILNEKLKKNLITPILPPEL